MKHCVVPPRGWYCTREAGHEGPCAAVPKTDWTMIDTLGQFICAFLVISCLVLFVYGIHYKAYIMAFSNLVLSLSNVILFRMGWKRRKDIRKKWGLDYE